MNRIPSMIVSIGLYFLSSAAETFPETYSPYLLCSGVVDYDFILPNDETFASLNTKAIAMMSASWGLINAECKSDMKRLTCAMVYLPSTTKRPCRSLCDATSAQGTTCAGMMEAFGTAVNCSTDLFDPSNDPLLCNAMEATEVPIHPPILTPFPHACLPPSPSSRTLFSSLSSQRSMLAMSAKV
jgi:hypothetical protein